MVRCTSAKCESIGSPVVDTSVTPTRRGLVQKNNGLCGVQDLTLQAILSNGVATVRQTLRRMFSAMAAERAKKRRKLVLTPDNNSYEFPTEK